MRLAYYTYKGIKKIKRSILLPVHSLVTLFYFHVYNVKNEKINSSGVPFLHIEKKGSMTIGDDFKMNNGLKFNPIGYVNPCVFVVLNGAKLKIGRSVGMSQTTIVCHESISIGDYVKLGGGVKIYDTDFHSINFKDRIDSKLDILNKKTAPVSIGDHAFIGAGSIILKGVQIGNNSIVGAGSLVTRRIPANEIWGGNPAKFIKKLNV